MRSLFFLHRFRLRVVDFLDRPGDLRADVHHLHGVDASGGADRRGDAPARHGLGPVDVLRPPVPGEPVPDAPGDSRRGGPKQHSAGE